MEAEVQDGIVELGIPVYIGNNPTSQYMYTLTYLSDMH